MKALFVILAISSCATATTSDRFTVDSHGVILHHETGLHWYCSDDGNSHSLKSNRGFIQLTNHGIQKLQNGECHTSVNWNTCFGIPE
jgi:hypothetical protein